MTTENNSNYGIRQLSGANQSTNPVIYGDNLKSSEKGDLYVYKLPPPKSYRIASDDPVPAEDYNNLRDDYFLLRQSYDSLIRNLDSIGIIKLIERNITLLIYVNF